jgi:mono/diheme cytochrome c family protein
MLRWVQTGSGTIIGLLLTAIVWLGGGAGTSLQAAQGGRPWSAPAEFRSMSNPVTVTPASLARGQELFGEYCTMCHGPKGRGDGSIAASLARRPADLSNASRLNALSDGELFWRISTGDDVMPSFEQTFGLPAEDRWHLINYLRRLSR